MTTRESRSRLMIGATLSLANAALVASLALAGLVGPANAQGQSGAVVEKPTRAVACRSGYGSDLSCCTDQNDSTSCVSPRQDKAPASQLKKGC
jgi:hypothetical protein